EFDFTLLQSSFTSARLFITEPVLKSLSFHICGLKAMKMFLPVLLCLCFWRLDVKSVSVMEGDSVTLNSPLTEIQR
ncbi:hypothetical protein PO909_027663, partial [Leuciscus waleckii]